MAFSCKNGKKTIGNDLGRIVGAFPDLPCSAQNRMEKLVCRRKSADSGTFTRGSAHQPYRQYGDPRNLCESDRGYPDRIAEGFRYAKSGRFDEILNEIKEDAEKNEYTYSASFDRDRLMMVVNFGSGTEEIYRIYENEIDF